MGEKEHKSVTVRETDDGIVIEIKGDRENLKRKKEAIEAFFEFRDKFWDAFGPKEGPLAKIYDQHHRHHHHHGGGESAGGEGGDDEVEGED
ncbi:MAG TPA: hypothetical protein VGL40_10285 [Bacillota bacterium]